jgi:hypothetical protein
MSFRTISLSFLLLAAVFFLFSACFSHSVVKKGSVVAFYNMENLFDTVDDPHTSDEEFLPTSKLQWDQQKYTQKLDRLSEVIEALDKESLALLGVAELENKRVLDDLLHTPRLSNKGFDYVHEDSDDPRGIDVALVYQKKKFTVLFHKVLKPCRDHDCLKSRDILAVKGLMQKDTVWVMVNHWPSRREGQEASDPKRLLVAQVLKHTIDSVLKSSPSSKVIVMGDLNDLPTDAAPQSLTKDRSLFNPFAVESLMQTGSIQYKKEWLLYDQVLLSSNWKNVSKGRISYQDQSAAVFHPDYLHYKNSQKNGPYRSYRGQTYFGGYSDHFPVYIRLND